MKNRNSIGPKVKTRLRLRKIVLYTTGVAIISAIVWKFIIGTAVTIGNPGNVMGMFTPSNGPQVTGYSWMKTITINSSQVMDTVDLIDFPLLISFTENDLRSTANGGSVASDFGYDIVFSGANEAQLDHQIESYNPVTGEYVAWVRLPILYHDVDTELNISCGNSSVTADQSTENVWSSSHEAVWHMCDDPSVSELNDAAGTFNGQANGNMTSSDLVDGKIGSAIDFDGTNDFFAIEDKNYSSSGAINELTVSGCVNTSFSTNSWTGNWALLDFDRSEYFNFFIHGQGKVSFCTRGAVAGIHDFHSGQSGQVNDGNWHYVVGTISPTKKQIYIDGVLVNTINNPHNGSDLGTGATRYGFIGDGSEASGFNGNRNNIYYKGKIDELRFLNVQLSAGWIATEFNNQSSPESFYSLGDPYNLPIELIAFNAELKGKEVFVDWSTASQRDNDYFTIERSIDGTEFDIVGEVDGAGNSTEILKYEFVDTDPLEGFSYYRLRQTDFNGETEAFAPVSINYIIPVDRVSIETVYPNPFTNMFTVDFSMSTSSEVEIMMTNSNGMQVFSDAVVAEEGQNKYVFYSDSDLKTGMYFLNIIQNGEILASTKVMKR